MCESCVCVRGGGCRFFSVFVFVFVCVCLLLRDSVCMCVCVCVCAYEFYVCVCFCQRVPATVSFFDPVYFCLTMCLYVISVY